MVLNAINSETPQLLTVNPSAYFFNQLEDRGINGIQNQGQLQVPLGKNLTLLGGDLDLFGGFLFAPGGLIELGSLQGTGKITISNEGNLTFPENVNRGDVFLSNGSRIVVYSGGSGFVKVNAQDFELSENSDISAGIFSGFGSLDAIAGDIEIDLTGNLLVDNSFIVNKIFPEARGTGAKIQILAQSIELKNGGRISSDSNGQGNTGAIAINATDSIIFDGASSIGNGSGVSNLVFKDAKGDAEDIELTTNFLSLTNGGRIASINNGQGNTSSIAINASDSIVFDGETIVFNEENEPISLVSGVMSSIFQGEGNGGSININTGSLSVTNGAEISARTLGQGNGGSTTINATDSIIFDGVSSIGNSSGISSSVSPEAVGNAGDISISTDSLKVINGAAIDSRTESQGNGGLTAGNITLKADSIIAFDESNIFANAADGKGGNITLDTPAFFGENFTLNSLTETDTSKLRNNNRVDINATGAVSGFVSLPDVSFIQNSLTELPNNALNTDELVANSCVVPAGNRSKGTFIITGGESLPLRPGDNLPSKYPTGEVRNVPENNNSSWQPGDPIIEPQGVYRLTNGKLVLSRECL